MPTYRCTETSSVKASNAPIASWPESHNGQSSGLSTTTTSQKPKQPPPPAAPGGIMPNIPSNMFQLVNSQEEASYSESNQSNINSEREVQEHQQQDAFPPSQQSRGTARNGISTAPQETAAFANTIDFNTAEHHNQQHATAQSPFKSNNTMRVTRVDGKGLWRAWKRSFNSQFTAILDLVDNSLDASIKNIDQGFKGRCYIAPDTYTYTDSNGWNISITTGITIINNCISKPRPLQQCLEVYDSSKVNSGKDSVGENGVGLKQATATLSDSSFVLVKSVRDEEILCELGIVAEALQKVEGAFLPAFQFRTKTNSSDIRAHLIQQMHDLFSQPQYAEVAACIAGYGRALNNNIDSIMFGINRLCEQFSKLCIDEFGDSSYVFAVIVDKIRHDNVEERTGMAADTLTKIHVDGLMQELRSKIPRTYLHIPNSFEFIVDEKIICFNYWPKRLVEFTHFNLKVGTGKRFYDLGPQPDRHCVNIKVYVGFDAQVLNNNSEKKTGALYIYSRLSGRLITHHVDARTMLGLSAGGTEFCSGLRIIVDDADGHLPLNPTKQDIAFSEKANGDILRENLWAWVGAVTSLFYKHHMNRCGGKKLLTSKIKEYAGNMSQENLLQSELCKLQLTTFVITKKKMTKNAVGGMTIRLSGDQKVGKDTEYRIVVDDSPPQSPQVAFEPVTRSPGSSISNKLTEHISKKRKLDETNATFTCKSCHCANGSTGISCIYCNSSRPGSLLEKTSQTERSYELAPICTNSTWTCYCGQPNNPSFKFCFNCKMSQPKSQQEELRASYAAITHQAPSTQNTEYHQSNYYFQHREPTQNTTYLAQHTYQSGHGADKPFKSPIAKTATAPQQHNKNINVSEPRNFSIAASATPNDNAQAANNSQNSEEKHYENLCTMLTEKLEKVNAKMERRKYEIKDLIKKNSLLEREVEEWKIKVATLEMQLKGIKS